VEVNSASLLVGVSCSSFAPSHLSKHITDFYAAVQDSKLLLRHGGEGLKTEREGKETEEKA
jgi:hypothetical protein